VKRITSRDNPTFKLLRQLAHSGRERRKQGRTILDGLHLVECYCRMVGTPDVLVLSERGAGRAEIAEFVGSAAAERIMLADALFEEVSPSETPPGILALIAIPLAAGRIVLDDTCVVLDAIQDAGNVGSILRSAAAAGVRHVLLTEGCAQAWSPKVLRAAMGAHFALTIVEHADALRLLASYPGRILATRSDARDSLYEMDLRGGVAWLFGNEGAGLSPTVAVLAQDAVRIPMPGAAESLNVAAAAAICLFEQLRQHQAGKSRAGSAPRA
jgi:RNA methyltransferase, TrmH family